MIRLGHSRVNRTPKAHHRSLADRRVGHEKEGSLSAPSFMLDRGTGYAVTRIGANSTAGSNGDQGERLRSFPGSGPRVWPRFSVEHERDPQGHAELGDLAVLDFDLLL
jgi:hypothetical protein